MRKREGEGERVERRRKRMEKGKEEGREGGGQEGGREGGIIWLIFLLKTNGMIRITLYP